MQGKKKWNERTRRNTVDVETISIHRSSKTKTIGRSKTPKSNEAKSNIHIHRSILRRIRCLVSKLWQNISVYAPKVLARAGRFTFWASAVVSMNQPIPQRITPAISQPVPNEEFDPPRDGSDTAGELRMVRGRETVQTCWTYTRGQKSAYKDTKGKNDAYPKDLTYLWII